MSNKTDNNETEDFDALIAEINERRAKLLAAPHLQRAEADLGLPHASIMPTTHTQEVAAVSNLAQRFERAVPVIAPVPPNNNRLAERIASLIANAKPKSAQQTIKKIVNDNYNDILKGYLAGISLVKIAEIMTDELGIVIKHGSLRTYFLPVAKQKGDVPLDQRGSR